MVYGDQGSSLALVPRYAFSLSCLGTVALTLLALSSSFWALSLNIPSLSPAAESCLVFVVLVPDFSGRVFEGIAASQVNSLCMLSRERRTRPASQLDLHRWMRLYIYWKGRLELEGNLRLAEMESSSSHIYTVESMSRSSKAPPCSFR